MNRPTKATHQETRAHNERLVLATIYDRRRISRAAVARETGLTRTTVSDVVNGLIADGLSHEVGRGPSTGGKAPILLEVPDDARYLVGIDLGEQTFRGAIVNLRGRVVRSVELPVADRDGDAAVELVFELVDRLLADVDRPIIGIGVGTPGLLDTSVGTVRQAVNLNWRDLPLGRLLGDRFGLPVYVANDSQATALAEHVFGRPRTANLIVVRVGRGIGAGIVLEGRLFQGDGFGAGEIGHTTVVDDGLECRCGRRGCLETVASSRAIAGQVALRSGSATIQPFEDIVARYAEGDPLVRSVVEEAASHLGAALAGLVGALDVQRIVLVGSVTALGDPWLEVVRETMRRRALALLTADTTVEIGGLDENEVVLGASALVLTRVLGLLLPADDHDRLGELEPGSDDGDDGNRELPEELSEPIATA